MKPRLLQLLVFVLLVGTWGFAEALEPLKLYDKFREVPINPDTWIGNQFEAPFRSNSSFLELARETIQDPEGRHLRILNRSFGQNTINDGNSLSLFNLRFTHPETITAIRSRVQVRNVESTGCPFSVNPTPTVATARIFGFFFNTGTPTPETGGFLDVIAGVQLQRRSDSADPPDVLEISYFVNHCLDFNCVGIAPLGGGSLGKVKTGEWVRLLVRWDKDRHQFIFRGDSGPPAIVEYTVSDAAAPGIQVKTIGADNFTANCDNTPRPVGVVDALFDNVFVNQSALP